MLLKIYLIIGIQDLVIGAPYDGEDHRGAIYIYLGTPDGISQTHSQVLYVTYYFYRHFVIYCAAY